jgi:hypothetical protein
MLPPQEGMGAPVPGLPALTAQSDGTPTKGWAVELLVVNDLVAAEAELVRLRGIGLPAYRLSAIIDGAPKHHLRVGGYESEKEATEGLPALVESTGAKAPVVLKAP